MDVVGGVLLWLAVVAAGASAVTAAARRPDASLRLLIGAAVAGAVALIALAWALVTDDFSLVYVADHSQRTADAALRLAGLWGGLAGSLLLWAALAAATAAVGARRLARQASDATALRCWTQAVLATFVAAALAITAALGRPFARLEIPALDGEGLVPILDHSAMLYHPPVVYLGVALLLVPFALVVGARMSGQRPAPVDALVRRLSLTAWILLAVGMAAGGNWAYVELGWGGYWAWDPVENTALLPWLAVTAQLHLTRVASALGRTATDAMALLAFTLAVGGGWLTRSGATPSVHAFAQTDDIGRALLALALAVVGTASIALVVGARRGGRPDAPVAARSRERAGDDDGAGDDERGRVLALEAQAALIVTAIALIAAGTLAPVITSWRTGTTSAVGGSYFATVTTPLAIALLVLVAVGPRWGEPGLADRLLWPGVLGLAAVATFLAMGWRGPATVALVGVAVFAGASSIDAMVRRRNHLASSSLPPLSIGATVAHLGVAVLIVGFAGSSAGHDLTATVSPGDRVVVDGVTVRNLGATSEPGPPPRVVVPIEISASGRVDHEAPSIVGFPERGQLLAESALWSTPGQDVQVVVRRADDAGAALLEIHVRPLAWCVWWGAALLGLGGLLALVGRRRPRRIAEDRPARIEGPSTAQARR